MNYWRYIVQKNQHNTKNNLSMEKRSNMNFLFRREQKIIVFFTKEESFEKNELVNVLYKKYGYKSIYYIFWHLLKNKDCISYYSIFIH